MNSKKTGTNELLYKTEIEFQMQKTSLWLERGGAGRDKLVNLCCHIHTTIYRADNNEDLLYSTGNSSQYCRMTYMRKESKKEWAYIYMCV